MYHAKRKRVRREEGLVLCEVIEVLESRSEVSGYLGNYPPSEPGRFRPFPPPFLQASLPKNSNQIVLFIIYLSFHVQTVCFNSLSRSETIVSWQRCGDFEFFKLPLSWSRNTTNQYHALSVCLRTNYLRCSVITTSAMAVGSFSKIQ